MPPIVSVIVPVHNPGGYIEPCIRSILRQTMRRDRFEVILVDDGSTDGTPERLDRLASEHQHIRVIHIPASGAPGRPRNVGLEAAGGEYVQFLDADDELARTALSRLYRMASRNGSDIVLGKFASETMYRRQDLFTRNRPATTLEETPSLVEASMGPTKLFRTALLREHDITFPEGWRQMEDQLFTLRAYLAAKVISVLADEPCYYFNKREDEAHISAELVEPASHVSISSRSLTWSTRASPIQRCAGASPRGSTGQRSWPASRVSGSGTRRPPIRPSSSTQCGAWRMTGSGTASMPRSARSGGSGHGCSSTATWRGCSPSCDASTRSPSTPEFAARPGRRGAS